MLIGAVEAVTPENVSGWIYSPLQDLHGTMVLAFVDRECVGSGIIEIFRQDLADAGLSHGRFGFHFPIVPPGEEAVSRVVVRPEGCEAVILQRDSVVTCAPRAAGTGLVGGRLPGSGTVAWLRKRQAISKDESDFLGSLGDFGVAAWPLRPARPGTGVGTADRDEAACGVIELCDVAATRIGRAEFSDARELAEALGNEDHPISQAGLLVFHADEALTFSVVEGSHKVSKRMLIADALDRGITYTAEPDSLLVVHRLCAFRVERTGGRRFTVHYPLDATGRAGT